jgi:hypothetical protein
MPNQIHHSALVSSDARGPYSRRSVLKTAGAVAAGTVIGAMLPLGRGAVRAAEKGGTLVWGMPAETDILDPHATGGWLMSDCH